MSTDVRPTNPNDLPFRLTALYAADAPGDVVALVDRRVEEAIAGALRRQTSSPTPRFLRLPVRRRASAFLLVVALTSLAATPAVRQFFDGWGKEFDQVFAVSTAINQSVIDGGYQVTLVRAYADPFSVRLAIAAEDLEDRGWAEVAVGHPTVTDENGRTYPLSVGQYAQPTTDSSEGWLKFSVPPDATAPGVRHLTVSVDGLGVRSELAPALASQAVDFEDVWTTVPGRWSFDFDLEFLGARTVEPNVTSSAGEVTVTLDELTVTPGATVGRLTFAGLPEVETSWDPELRLEHDGKDIPLGITAQATQQDQFAFEARAGFDDLTGSWTIVIEDFHRPLPDPTGEDNLYETIDGPWVLTFEVPSEDAR